jgi:hypothetical protein
MEIRKNNVRGNVTDGKNMKNAVSQNILLLKMLENLQNSADFQSPFETVVLNRNSYILIPKSQHMSSCGSSNPRKDPNAVCMLGVIDGYGISVYDYGRLKEEVLMDIIQSIDFRET